MKILRLSIILSLLIITFYTSCKKETQGSQEIKSSDSISSVINGIDSFYVSEEENYPICIRSQSYNTIRKGVYESKSTDQQFTDTRTNLIDTYQLRDTMLLYDGHCMYIANEKPIALFKTRFPKNKEDVAGILNGGSLVYVDSIFYNSIYCNSDKAPMSMETWYKVVENESFDKYPLTYDVWYAITINGKIYYTDYKLHNYIEASIYIPAKGQMVLFCSQGTGYDGDYDRGYPDLYEIVVFQKPENTGDIWKQIYRSQKLDLNDGGSDEYGLGESLMDKNSLIDSNNNLVLKVEDSYQLKWDGKSLSVQWDKNYHNKDNNN